MEEADGGSHLSLVPTDQGIEVVDAALESWIVRFEPMPDLAAERSTQSLAATTTLASFGQQLPELRRLLGDAGSYRVVFSSEARRALLSGQYSLMRSGFDFLPTAVDASGRIAEIGRITPGLATGAGGTLTLGAAFTVAWPLALAAGMGAAAAIAEQRWLERTFGELQSSLHRLELRMRDADFGQLEAANRLVEQLDLRGEAALPPVLQLELAHAHYNVESIYWARRRFVERFKRRLEDEQTKHETKTGTPVAWAGSTAADLGDTGTGTIDELVVFVAAMISRARTTSALSATLARDGHGLPALRAIDSLHDSLREDYNDLYRRLNALARQDPSVPKWKQLIPMVADDAEAGRARDLTRRLTDYMESMIGSALPARDEVLVLASAPMLLAVEEGSG